MNQLGLIIQNDKVVVSSRKVSEIYEKEHAKVIRSIKEILETVPEGHANFGLTSYTDQWNRDQPEYIMDRQGFSMLVMGFTGEKAKRFTYQYTLAFEKMAKELEKPRQLSPMEQPSYNTRSLKITMKGSHTLKITW